MSVAPEQSATRQPLEFLRLPERGRNTVVNMRIHRSGRDVAHLANVYHLAELFLVRAEPVHAGIDRDGKIGVTCVEQRAELCRIARRRHDGRLDLAQKRRYLAAEHEHGFSHAHIRKLRRLVERRRKKAIGERFYVPRDRRAVSVRVRFDHRAEAVARSGADKSYIVPKPR